MYKGIIVDDAAIMRHRLRSILETDFLIVDEASNGVEALDLYSKYKPDFLTLDISMPEMNGLETLKNLIEAYPDAKIVIVSAVGQKQIVFEALSMGAKDFIVKPFDPERVLQSVKRLF
jgi:two-component system chemotaxis response regulator CheY